MKTVFQRVVVWNEKIEAYKKEHTKKIELKITDKALAKKAKETGRINRGEVMDYFAVYYKEKCGNAKLSSVKLLKDIPWRI